MAIDFEVLPEECFYNSDTQIAQFTFQNSGTADVTSGSNSFDGVEYWLSPIVEVTTDSSESNDREPFYYTEETTGTTMVPAGTIIYKKNNLNYYYKTATDHFTNIIYSTHIGKTTGTTYYIQWSGDLDGGIGFKDYIAYRPGLKAGDDLKVQLKVTFEDNKNYMFAADDFTYYTWSSNGNVTETIDDSHNPAEDRNNYYVVSTGDSIIAEIEGESTISNYTETSTDVTINSSFTVWDSYLSKNPGNESTINKTFLKKILNDIGSTEKNIIIPTDYLSMGSLSNTTTSYQLIQASTVYSIDMNSQTKTDGFLVVLEDTESFTIDLNDNNSSDILQESSNSFRIDYLINSTVKKTYSKTKSEKLNFQQSTNYKVEYRMNPLQIEFIETDGRNYLKNMIPDTRQKQSMIFSIKVVQNILGENVFAVRDKYDTEFYRQPNLSFNSATNKFAVFDVSDSSMDPYTLVFGTTRDGPYNSSVSDIVVKYKTNSVKLITNNASDIYFFEQNNANMGYIPVDTGTITYSSTIVSKNCIGVSADGKYVYAAEKFNNGSMQLAILKSSDFGKSFAYSLNDVNGNVVPNYQHSMQLHNYLFVNSLGTVALIHSPQTSVITFNGGSSWANLHKKEAVCSDSGQYIAALSTNIIHVSSDYGTTWTDHTYTMDATALAMSLNGQYIYTANTIWDDDTQTGSILMSNDYGVSFFYVTLSSAFNNDNFHSIRYIQCSGDGKYAYFVGHNAWQYLPGFMYTNDYGATIVPWTGLTMWQTNTIRQNAGLETVTTPTDSETLYRTRGPYDMRFSYDGRFQALHFKDRIDYNYDFIFISEDYGVTWDIDTSLGLQKISNNGWTMSKSGKHFLSPTNIRHDYRYITHTVQVENNAFVIDGTSKNNINLSDYETHYFNQSDSSNLDKLLTIGTTADDTSTLVSQTIRGHPGKPGAFTMFDSDGSTLFYFNDTTDNMGYK
jgi:hypothetical protein